MDKRMIKYRDNYEMICENWRKKSLDWDYEERYAALGLPGYVEGKMPITYYGTDYVIEASDGTIHEASDWNKELEFQTLMSIYHIFYYSRENPRNANIWIPFRDVKRAAPFAEAFQRQTLEPFAKAFDGKAEKLQAAGEKLGFLRLCQSDVGFQAMAFPCMPLQFLFWDGDDEFGAQTNILFDANITDFVHEETVVMIADQGVRRLIEAAELEVTQGVI